MKELTHEEWMENPTPRMMWVWNGDIKYRLQAKVICVIKPDTCVFPVLSVTDDNLTYETYQYCAEIEKQRRMTNKELARWLRENPTREFKYDRQCDKVYYAYNYYDSESNKEVNPELVIRENDGEWREPLIEVEE